MMLTRTKILLVITSLSLTLVLATSTRENSAQRERQGRHPITILQSSESLLDEFRFKRSITTSPKNGQNLYALDQTSGDVVVYHRKNKRIAQIVSTTNSTAELLAVNSQGNVYLGNSQDATVQIINTDEKQVISFPVLRPFSIGALRDNNVVVASPHDGKLLHLYSSEGKLIRSFGEMKSFDGDGRENEFLNRGKVVVGPEDEIYYVSMYAPYPYAVKFSAQGQFLKEFSIEGQAIDFQRENAKGFLNERKSDCVGGFIVITSATIEPSTGHLWVAMNGLSTTANLYEYDSDGTKIREYAFLFDSNTGKRNVTHLRDVVVSGTTISLLSWGSLYQYDVKDTVAPDITASKKVSLTRPSWWGSIIGRFSASAPVTSLIPQSTCPPEQGFTCTANCPSGSNPTTVNCKTQIDTRLTIGDTVTQSMCTQKTIDPTPGSSAPGGCSQTVNFCNPNDGGQPITGTISVEVNCNPVPTPAPTPTPPPGGGGGDECNGDPCCYDPICCLDFCCTCETIYGLTCMHGSSCNGSPIIIDVAGNGFNLTNTAGGVAFDLGGKGKIVRIPWTAAGSDDAFLALDRNANGSIDNGKELFGNFTPQPPSNELNGFLALAEYDKAESGGNSDGAINRHDAIFANLRLWQDTNHNGLSETSELYTLPALGVAKIELDYRESRRTDEHGNQFKYRAKVKDARDAHVGRWAWDVFFVIVP